MHPTPRTIALLISLIAPSALAVDPAEPRMFTFENDRIGAPPASFEFARTGGGAEGKWTVELERGGKNHVLLQSSADKTDYRFPVAVVKNASFHDVTLTVRARPLAGVVDQGFGLVWRYRNADNYYITRCNALEDNCTIYHVINGSRRPFQNHSVRVAGNVWHTLKMEARGNHFVVWFDDQKVLDARDDSFQSGQVGLWTKADSVIEFNDFTIAP
ncbi:MAG TPA: family 16 glycoside hydrolase [Thermoanaerobaculia bacterium]